MEIIDTAGHINNRSIEVEKEILNMTLHYGMGQVQKYKYSVNYVG